MSGFGAGSNEGAATGGGNGDVSPQTHGQPQAQADQPQAQASQCQAQLTPQQQARDHLEQQLKQHAQQTAQLQGRQQLLHAQLQHQQQAEHELKQAEVQQQQWRAKLQQEQEQLQVLSAQQQQQQEQMQQQHQQHQQMQQEVTPEHLQQPAPHGGRPRLGTRLAQYVQAYQAESVAVPKSRMVARGSGSGIPPPWSRSTPYPPPTNPPSMAIRPPAPPPAVRPFAPQQDLSRTADPSPPHASGEPTHNTIMELIGHILARVDSIEDTVFGQQSS